MCFKYKSVLQEGEEEMVMSEGEEEVVMGEEGEW